MANCGKQQAHMQKKLGPKFPEQVQKKFYMKTN